MILKASAANGPLSSAGRVPSVGSVSPLAGGISPVTGGTSSGEGSISMTASSSGCTPLFLNEEPASTGVTLVDSVAWRSASFSFSTGISSSPRNASMIPSSKSAAASIRAARNSSALSTRPAGISSTSNSVPSSSFQTRAFIVTRSTTPRKSPSDPIGSWIGTALAPRRSFIVSTAL